MEVIRKRKNLTSVGPNSGTTTTVRRRTINKHHQHRRRFNTVLIVMMFCAVLLLLFITYYKMGLNTDMNILTDTLTSPSPGTLDDDDNDVSNDNLGKSANDIKIGVSTFSSTKSSSPIHNHKNVYYPIYDMQQHILKSFDEELFKSKSIHDIYSKKKIQAWNKLDSIDAYLSTSTTNTINSSNGSNGSTGSDSSDGSHGSIDSNGSSDSRSVMVMTRKSYKGGRLNQQVNQDRAIVILDPFSSIMPRNHQPGMIIGIFDGHSTQGHVVAHYVQQKLPKVLTKEISSILKLNNNNNANDAALEEQQEQIKQIIIQSFNTTDTNIPSTYSMEAGCTTSLMIQIDKSTIYAANVGDSQSFIIRYHHDKKKADVVYVTMKHKPEDEMERKRIENAGGHVFIPKRKFQEHNGVKMDISSRVTIPNTSIGPVSLAMSRSSKFMYHCIRLLSVSFFFFR